MIQLVHVLFYETWEINIHKIKYIERKYIQVWKGTSYMSYKISIER